MHVRGKKVKRVWKNHFEHLINEKTEWEAIVPNMGVEIGRKHVNVQKRSKETIDNLKCGTAAGVNGITAEMLKYGGETG